MKLTTSKSVMSGRIAIASAIRLNLNETEPLESGGEQGYSPRIPDPA
jgi:hypothetical protein